MGSGVSSEIVALSKDVKFDKDGKRKNALATLSELTDNVDYKAQMSSWELGLIKELAVVIKEDEGYCRVLACNCLIALSMDEAAKKNILDPRLDIIEVLIYTVEYKCLTESKIINEDLLRAIIVTISNCSSFGGVQNHLYSSQFDILSLVKKLLCISSNEILKIAIQILSGSFKFPDSSSLVPLFITKRIPESVIAVLEKSIDDSEAWGGNAYGDWCITFFMRFCFHRDASLYVKSIDGIQQVLQSVENCLTSESDKIEYFLMTTLIYGRDEEVNDRKESVLQVYIVSSMLNICIAFRPINHFLETS